MNQQQITIDVLLEKYAKGNEQTPDEIFKRVAKGIASVESSKLVERSFELDGVIVKKKISERSYWESKFYQNMKRGAVGAGRIMSAAGTDVDATLVNCFSGDTTALTDKGPKQLKELVGTSTNVMTAKGWKQAEVKSFGIQRIYEILFANGQKIKATAGHDWFVTGHADWFSVLNNLEKVKTTELINRKVPILKSFIRPVKDDDFDKGIIHGIVYGDGSKIINRSDNAYYLHLFQQKKELSKYFEKCSQSIKISNSYDSESIYIYGIKNNEVNLKEVPSLNNNSLSYIYGFICGLIATDGNVCSTKGNVTIYQSNYEEIQEIANLISKIGMSVTAVALYRKFSPFDGSIKPCYVVRIRKNSSMEEDFLRNDQKYSFNLKSNDRVQTETVILVTDSGIDEEVYCAVEPETHSFVIEGNILTGNCFTQPVGDSITGLDKDGHIGIYDALTDSAETLRRGGGVGYDFSYIRPKNAKVGKVGAMASGPCSYMNIFNSSCETIESAGQRRGAQMGSLRIDHPDIEDFIKAKRTPGRWNNFNVSVFVTDSFMQSKNNDEYIELVHKAEPSKILTDDGAYKKENGDWVYKKVKASDLWDLIMKSNYDFAEPGILFADNINNDNNLNYCEYIRTTNPCVTGDTVILTSEGYIRIDSLVGQEVQIWNGYEWSYVIPEVTGENQEIFDMEFSDGSKLSCTPYHKFILEDGSRIEAKDLQTSHRLAKFSFPVISGTHTVPNKTAYTQGFYSGDGQVDTNRIWLYNGKCDLLYELSLSAYSDQSTETTQRLMATMDFPPSPKDFVPSHQYAIHTRLWWLAGLLDSDGSCEENDTITIWSVNRDFLNRVKLLLNTLGATGTISLGKKATVKQMPDGKGGFGNYNCQDCWRITISGYYAGKLKQLGLTTHRINIDEKVTRQSSRFIHLTFKMKRTHLEPKVYCFNEEKNHSGIFNGIMTAQCGEQPLPDYGCCDLGPIILPKFVSKPFSDKTVFLIDDLIDAVKTHVRFLDNVLDATLWPLEKQRIESSSKRRVGLGFTGLANMLSMMGLAYNTKEGLNFAELIVSTIRNTAYEASVELAKERGPFPLFDAKKYLKEGTFASRLPKKIKADIRKYGIRNSHLLSVAPVGTISLAFADNASNGIEPPFSLAYTRKKRMADGSKQEYAVVDHSLRVYLKTLEDKFATSLLDAICNYNDSFEHDGKTYNVKEALPKSIVTALELTPTEHLAMMEVVQPYIDSSISKTVNIPEDYSFDDFKTVYDQAWNSKLKGVATYRPNSILGSVLSVEKPKEVKEESKTEIINNVTCNDVDPNSIIVLKRPLGKLASISDKIQYYGDHGDYTFYVSVSFMKVNGVRAGQEVTVDRPIEIFITVSPSSVPLEWVTVYSRTMSLIARTSLALFVKALQDNRSISSGKQIRYDWYEKEDGTKVPRHHGSDVAVISYAIQQILIGQGVLDSDGNIVISEITKDVAVSKKSMSKPEVKHVHGKTCPECGTNSLIKLDGCEKCTSCGYIGSCG